MKKTKARNEKTSKRLASVAGRILRELKYEGFTGDRDVMVDRHNFPPFFLCNVRELKALAASCLTQTANRAPDQPRKRGKQK